MAKGKGKTLSGIWLPIQLDTTRVSVQIREVRDELGKEFMAIQSQFEKTLDSKKLGQGFVNILKNIGSVRDGIDALAKIDLGKGIAFSAKNISQELSGLVSKLGVTKSEMQGFYAAMGRTQAVDQQVNALTALGKATGITGDALVAFGKKQGMAVAALDAVAKANDATAHNFDTLTASIGLTGEAFNKVKAQFTLNQEIQKDLKSLNDLKSATGLVGEDMVALASKTTVSKEALDVFRQSIIKAVPDDAAQMFRNLADSVGLTGKTLSSVKTQFTLHQEIQKELKSLNELKSATGLVGEDMMSLAGKTNVSKEALDVFRQSIIKAVPDDASQVFKNLADSIGLTGKTLSSVKTQFTLHQEIQKELKSLYELKSATGLAGEDMMSLAGKTNVSREALNIFRQSVIKAVPDDAAQVFKNLADSIGLTGTAFNKAKTQFTLHQEIQNDLKSLNELKSSTGLAGEDMMSLAGKTKVSKEALDVFRQSIIKAVPDDAAQMFRNLADSVGLTGKTLSTVKTQFTLHQEIQKELKSLNELKSSTGLVGDDMMALAGKTNVSKEALDIFRQSIIKAVPDDAAQMFKTLADSVGLTGEAFTKAKAQFTLNQEIQKELKGLNELKSATGLVGEDMVALAGKTKVSKEALDVFRQSITKAVPDDAAQVFRSLADSVGLTGEAFTKAKAQFTLNQEIQRDLKGLHELRSATGLAGEDMMSLAGKTNVSREALDIFRQSIIKAVPDDVFSDFKRLASEMQMTGSRADELRTRMLKVSETSEQAAKLDKWARALDLNKREAKAFARELGITEAALKQYQATQQDAGRGLAGILTPSNLTSGVQAGLAAVGVTAGIYGMVELAKAATQSALRLDSLKVAFESVTGSAASSEVTLSKIREISDRLGLSFMDTAEGAKSLFAAAQDTSLKDRATDIFESFAMAGTALKLTGEQMNSVFLAIGQMMSKGKISAEELRLQLAERFPGAVNLFAKSIGVTTKELDKMLQAGEVGLDSLGKFSDAIRTKYADPAASASRSMQAEFNRVATAWNDLKQSLVDSDGITESVRSIATLTDTVRSGVEFIKEYDTVFKALVAGISSAALMRALAAIVPAFSSFAALKAGFLALDAALVGVFATATQATPSIAAMGLAVKGLAASLGPIGWAALAAAAAVGAMSYADSLGAAETAAKAMDRAQSELNKAVRETGGDNSEAVSNIDRRIAAYGVAIEKMKKAEDDLQAKMDEFDKRTYSYNQGMNFGNMQLPVKEVNDFTKAIEEAQAAFARTKDYEAFIKSLKDIQEDAKLAGQDTAGLTSKIASLIEMAAQGVKLKISIEGKEELEKEAEKERRRKTHWKEGELLDYAEVRNMRLKGIEDVGAAYLKTEAYRKETLQGEIKGTKHQLSNLGMLAITDEERVSLNKQLSAILADQNSKLDSMNKKDKPKAKSNRYAESFSETIRALKQTNDAFEMNLVSSSDNIEKAAQQAKRAYETAMATVGPELEKARIRGASASDRAVYKVELERKARLKLNQDEIKINNDRMAREEKYADLRMDFEKEYAEMKGLSSEAVNASIQRQYDAWNKAAVDIVALEEWKTDKIRRNSREGVDGAIVALEDYKKEASNMAKNMGDAFGTYIKGIDSAFKDMWVSFLEDGKISMSSMKTIFAGLLADIAHMAITRPITIAIAGSLTEQIQGSGLMNMIGGAANSVLGMFGGAQPNASSGSGGNGGGGGFNIGNLPMSSLMPNFGVSDFLNSTIPFTSMGSGFIPAAAGLASWAPMAGTATSGIGAGLAGWSPMAGTAVSGMPAGVAGWSSGMGIGGSGVPMSVTPAGAMGATSGVSFGTALGYGGWGSLGYSTLGALAGLPQSKYSGLTAGVGSAALGTAGSMLASSSLAAGTGMATGAAFGSVLPVVGTIVGAIIGGLGGSLLGGKKPKRPAVWGGMELNLGNENAYSSGYDFKETFDRKGYGRSAYELTEKGNYVIASRDRNKAGDASSKYMNDLLKSVAEASVKQVDDLQAMIPEEYAKQFKAHLANVPVKISEDLKGGDISDEGFKKLAERLQASINQSMLMAYQAMDLSAYDGRLNIDKSSIDGLNKFASAIKAMDDVMLSIGEAKDPSSEFEKQAKAVDEQVKTWKKGLTDLGWTAGEAAKAEELRTITMDNMLKSVRESISPVSQIAQQAKAHVKELDGMVEAFKTLQATEEKLAEATNLVNEVKRKSIDAILTEIEVPGSTQNPYQAAIDNFNNTMRGGVEALKEYGATAEEMARAEKAIETARKGMVSDILSGLQTPGSKQENPYAAQVSAFEAQSKGAVEALKALNATTEEMAAAEKGLITLRKATISQITGGFSIDAGTENPYKKAMEDLEANIVKAIEALMKLGATEVDITQVQSSEKAYREREISGIMKSLNDSVRGVTSFNDVLKGINQTFDESIESLHLLGAANSELIEVEKLRQQAIEQAIAQAYDAFNQDMALRRAKLVGDDVAYANLQRTIAAERELSEVRKTFGEGSFELKLTEAILAGEKAQAEYDRLTAEIKRLEEIKLRQEQQAIKSKQDAIREQQKELQDQQKAIQNQQKALRDQQKAFQDQQKALREQQKAIQAQQKEYQDQQRALQEKAKGIETEMRAAETLKTAWERVIDTIKNSRFSMWTTEQPGQNPMSAMYSAQSEFDSLYAKAMGGDSEAAEKLGPLADTLLDLKRNTSKSSSEYLDYFYDLDEKLKNAATVAGDQYSLAEKQYDTAKEQLDALNTQIETIQKQYDELTKQTEALDTQIEALNKQSEALDKQIEELNKQSEALDKQAEILQTQYDELAKQSSLLQSQYDAMHDQTAGITNIGALIASLKEQQAAADAALKDAIEKIDITVGSGGGTGGWGGGSAGSGGSGTGGSGSSGGAGTGGGNTGGGKTQAEILAEKAADMNNGINLSPGQVAGGWTAEKVLEEINKTFAGGFDDWYGIYGASEGYYNYKPDLGSGGSKKTMDQILKEKADAMNKGLTLGEGQQAGGWTPAKVLTTILQSNLSFSSWYEKYGKLEGFANGGNPPVGKAVLVGEKGPEVAVFSSPARVYSNQESMTTPTSSGYYGGSTMLSGLEETVLIQYQAQEDTLAAIREQSKKIAASEKVMRDVLEEVEEFHDDYNDLSKSIDGRLSSVASTTVSMQSTLAVFSSSMQGYASQANGKLDTLAYELDSYGSAVLSAVSSTRTIAMNAQATADAAKAAALQAQKTADAAHATASQALSTANSAYSAASYRPPAVSSGGGSSSSSSSGSSSSSSSGSSSSSSSGFSKNQVLAKKAAAMNKGLTLGEGQKAGGWTPAKVLDSITAGGMDFGDWYNKYGRKEGFANGGRPPVGTPVMVGERGRELAVFDSPARIYSNEDTQRMLRTAPPEVQSKSSDQGVLDELKEIRRESYDMMRQMVVSLNTMLKYNRTTADSVEILAEGAIA